MKQQLIILALRSLATAAPLGTAFADEIVNSPDSSRESVERALDWLQEQASERDATRSDYESVARTIVQRAREVIAVEGDFIAFTNDLWSSLGRAIDDLEHKARKRGATREDYEAVVELLHSRARSLMGAPSAVEASGDLRRALSWLADQASERNATREDYEDAAAEVIARARVHFGANEIEFLTFAASLEQTMRDQLSRLRAAIEKRTATREQYLSIVDMLFSRAREVGGV